jgi:hypothetical protein
MKTTNVLTMMCAALLAMGVMTARAETPKTPKAPSEDKPTVDPMKPIAKPSEQPAKPEHCTETAPEKFAAGAIELPGVKLCPMLAVR